MHEIRSVLPSKTNFPYAGWTSVQHLCPRAPWSKSSLQWLHWHLQRIESLLKLTNFDMIYCQWINLCQARGKKTILVIQDSVSSMIAKSMFIRIPKMFKSQQNLENRWVLKMISEKDICSKYCTMDLSPSHLCQMICLSNNKPAVWEVASIGTSFPKNSTCLWYQPSALQEKHGF